MRKTLREPALVLTLVVVVGLLGFFVIYPQLRVVLVPGLAGYVEFFREQTWVKPLLHSLQITVLSTTTAVTLGFVYAYAMVYSDMPRWFMGCPDHRLFPICLPAHRRHPAAHAAAPDR